MVAIEDLKEWVLFVVILIVGLLLIYLLYKAMVPGSTGVLGESNFFGG